MEKHYKAQVTNRSIFCLGCGNSRATLGLGLVPLSFAVFKAWLDKTSAGLVWCWQWSHSESGTKEALQTTPDEVLSIRIHPF